VGGFAVFTGQAGEAASRARAAYETALACAPGACLRCFGLSRCAMMRISSWYCFGF